MEVSIPHGLDPELVWLGDGAWVARDPGVPDNDPRRILAYLEHKDDRIYVLWVRGRQEVCCYGTLREALRDVALCCSVDAAQTNLVAAQTEVQISGSAS